MEIVSKRLTCFCGTASREFTCCLPEMKASSKYYLNVMEPFCY